MDGIGSNKWLKSGCLQWVHAAMEVSAGHDYEGSSCTPSGKPVGLITSLKYLYSNAHSLGNKQDELEICVKLQSYNLITIIETWWDSSQLEFCHGGLCVF